jgi:hypothetical protein
MIAYTTASESLSSESRFGPGSEFGLENPLRFFALPTPFPKTPPNKVRHTLGFGYNAAGLVDSPLPFLHLLSQFGSLPASHNRQVEGGRPLPFKSFWAHHLIDFYRFSISKSLRLL